MDRQPESRKILSFALILFNDSLLLLSLLPFCLPADESLAPFHCVSLSLRVFWCVCRVANSIIFLL